MKIYTKTGDAGETSLFGGARVDKNNLRIEAYGTVDELNSFLGLALSEKLSPVCNEILLNVQNLLFAVGSELASPDIVKKKLARTIIENDVKVLEDHIDEIEKELSPLKNFILPGGCRTSSLLHISRTVCRRAERRIVALNSLEEVSQFLLSYINRLSDLLFVLARYENYSNSTPDVIKDNRG